METGVKFKSQEEANTEAEFFFKALSSRMGDCFLREVRAAYYYAFEGHLVNSKGEKIELYRLVDFKQAKELVGAFREFFKQSFSDHFKNQTFYLKSKDEVIISEDELNERLVLAIDTAISDFKKNGKYDRYGVDKFIFDRLTILGKNPISEARFSQFIKEGEGIVKNEARTQLRGENSIGKIMNLKKILNGDVPIEKQASNRAKALAVNELIKGWIEFDLTGKDIIE